MRLYVEYATRGPHAYRWGEPDDGLRAIADESGAVSGSHGCGTSINWSPKNDHPACLWGVRDHSWDMPDESAWEAAAKRVRLFYPNCRVGNEQRQDPAPWLDGCKECKIADGPGVTHADWVAHVNAARDEREALHQAVAKITDQLV